jgi:hypothetical protein
MSNLSQLLRITAPDAPVYRIFPLWFFEEALRQRQLVLMPPREWDDPYEDLAVHTMITDQSVTPWLSESLEKYLRPAYAQCWSQTGDSDTLLRAYSQVVKHQHHLRNTVPAAEGVRVTSTPQKLLAAMQEWAKERPGMSCFVGAVSYRDDAEIRQILTNLVENPGPHSVGRGQLRAELLLLKRRFFSHEAEVRMICVDDSEGPEQKMIWIPILPEIFDEVQFDPRLGTNERFEREHLIRGLGYAGRFGASDSYQGILLDLCFPRGWNKSE